MAPCLLAFAAAAADPPRVTGQTRLSATPAALSQGPAGPFNRIAFDLLHFGPPDEATAVSCLYPDGVRYRCDARLEKPEAGTAKRRVTVTIPDLGRGTRVVVRFATRAGHKEVPVDLVNLPQVVHEIEALLLPGGGQVTTGGAGEPVPILNMGSTRATTMPAMALTPLAFDACDQIRAEWQNVSATDPVFQSQFGNLNGSVIASRPVMPGSRVHPENLPEWLVMFPLSAIRVQFIAHYEVIYRVGNCSFRVISRPG